MASVFTNTIKDKRQKFIIVDPKKFKYKEIFKEFKKPYLTWNFFKPYETIILTPLHKTVYTQTNLPENIIYISTTSYNCYLFTLFLKLNLSNIYTLIDLTYSNFTHNFNYVYSCYLTNVYINLYSKNKNKNIKSISGIYRGSIWPEREAKEFFYINFLNLTDSRRLLTDYTSLLNDNISYKTLSYNLILQNVLF